MNIQNEQRNQGVQVIARAAAVLRLLGKETQGLSLGQIASLVDLPRSTVQRIVGALAEEGFISNSGGNGHIRLGPEIQKLGLALTSSPIDRLRPVIQRLAKDTGETVDLAVLRDDRMLFVDQIEGRHRLRTVSSIGETFPLCTTANGKAALACLSEVEATALILNEIQSTGAESNLPEFLAEIASIRAGALAVDENEHTDGISALGLGLLDKSGEVFALSIPVPSSRYERVKDTLVAALTSAKNSLGSD